MAHSRLDLQNKLEKVMHEVWEQLPPSTRKTIPDYAKNVYFQPPSGNLMKYPAIVYERSNGDTTFADDSPYLFEIRYQITVIDKNPDSVIPLRIAQFPKTIFDRNFITDNLHHDVFMMYF